MLPFTASFRKLFVYHYFIEVNFFSFSSVIYRNINLFYKVIMISSCCLTQSISLFPKKDFVEDGFHKVGCDYASRDENFVAFDKVLAFFSEFLPLSKFQLYLYNYNC